MARKTIILPGPVPKLRVYLHDTDEVVSAVYDNGDEHYEDTDLWLEVYDDSGQLLGPFNRADLVAILTYSGARDTD